MPALLERGRELGTLAEAIAEARDGSGRLALIQGPAGIGKTALLEAAREIAQDSGMLVLSARGRELEYEFAFGVARQLFEAPLARTDPERRDTLLTGAAGLVRPMLEGRADGPLPVRPAPDLGFTLTHGLYWLTANLADLGPLMIALDDAQYADEPSLRFVAYLSARCRELPIVLILTLRSGEPAATERLVFALQAEPDVISLRPGSLSQAAVAELVRATLGDDPAPEFCAACSRASAGNPFLLGELLAELRTEQVAPDRSNVAHVEHVSPDSVGRVVLARLVRLGPSATALARAVAVLEKASLQQAAALARLDTEDAQRAADDLVAAEILAADQLGFIHPLLRRSVYDQIPPAQRAADHRRAAINLAVAGAPHTVVGAHLLRAEPAGDPEAVQLLRRAGAEALGHGDVARAAALLRRALAEPPGAEVRAAVLGELGEAEALARDPAAAEHLSEALELSTEPAARARIACTLGELLVWSRGDAVQAHAVLTRTLEQLDGSPPHLRVAIETVRSATATVDARLVAEVQSRIGELRELAAAAGPAGRALKIFEACWRAQRGPYDGDWRSLLDEGLDGGRFVAEHTGGSPIVVYATIVLVLADEVERAESLLAEIRADAQARGSINSHLVNLAWGSYLALRRGELSTAAIDARATLELAEGVGALWVVTWMLACLAEALLGAGEVTEAARVIDQAVIEPMLGTSAALHALLARGRIRLAEGDRGRAAADLRMAGDSVIVNNPSFVPWRSELAMVLLPDDPEEAAALSDAALARAREIGQPRGIGVALRARGQVLGGVDGIALLNDSVQTLRGSPARLELARALVELGAALRRGGQRAAARDPLREALTLAQRCGAESLVALARDELQASGARLRRDRISGPESLTPSERRVAQFAAAGMANREIAQALFVTTKTVGTHLAHIYQKLGLGGQQAREQLGARLRAADERSGGAPDANAEDRRKHPRRG